MTVELDGDVDMAATDDVEVSTGVGVARTDVVERLLLDEVLDVGVVVVVAYAGGA